MRHPFHSFFGLLSVLLCFSCGRPGGSGAHEAAAPVRTSPFVFGEMHTFRSAILQQDRTLNVYLPEGRSPDSVAAYPVVYVLDGSANEDFPHIAGLVQFMNMYDLFPKSIVVGIANVDRGHDFTSPTQGDSDLVWVPTGGGSAAFIEFLEKEVQPFVAQRYGTRGPRTLIGQSLGGLLVMEVLFSRPDLFDDYIAVSPSLWWNNEALSRTADAWAGAHATLPKRVYIAMASDDGWGQPGVDRVVAVLRAHAAPPFIWWYETFPEETHATILHRGAYRAFELLGRAHSDRLAGVSG